MKNVLNLAVGAIAVAICLSILACTLPKTGPQTSSSTYDQTESADASNADANATSDSGGSETVNLAETTADPAPGLQADRLDILIGGLKQLRQTVRSRMTDAEDWLELVPEGQQVRYRGSDSSADTKLEAAGLAETMSNAYADGVCVPAQAECFSHCCSYRPAAGECEGDAQVMSAACFTGDSPETLALTEFWGRCPLKYEVEDIDANPGCLTDFEIRSPTPNICQEDAELQLFVTNNCSGPIEAGKQRIGANDKTGFVLGTCDDEICDFKLFGTAGARPLNIKVRVRVRTNAPTNYEAELVKARMR